MGKTKRNKNKEGNCIDIFFGGILFTIVCGLAIWFIVELFEDHKQISDRIDTICKEKGYEGVVHIEHKASTMNAKAKYEFACGYQISVYDAGGMWIKRF